MHLVAPLRKLTQKAVKFEFAGAATDACEHLKYCSSHVPVLALPDPELPYEVVVDASGFGCGAVSLQRQRLWLSIATSLAALSSTTQPGSRSFWL